MWRSVFLWILAVFVTISSAVYQRKTGPTYPIEGVTRVGYLDVRYNLLRSRGGAGDQPVYIETSDTSVTGHLIYRRYPTDEEWNRVPLVREDTLLTAFLPHQPPAGKLEYHVELSAGTVVISIPETENAIIRFKGSVPGFVLVPHILFMFFGMLLSTRAGLEVIRIPKREKFSLFSFIDQKKRVNGYVWWAIVLIFLGGLVFGPIVQKYAFGAYWTGFPFGTDLTDNKTLIAFLAWLIALLLLLKRPKSNGWVLLAAIVTWTIFMVPHSLHGSELDYGETELSKRQIAQ
jgi:hypothetical protein